ncbi:DMT family transporter [Pseudogulbenkiania ferrooxidans]|uniref:EamA domain-containing protein n=1 Tax=Pseudogulbenkiania ferrooxidans EGD-HP2 TaxID=1388764 RepID=A0ABP2XKR2_9NEIS|nr:DMT family transporter [Pseudogulbenkiania ferrooxidans]ERE06037.1 hypothetical protein O166_09360 [Pseudogulbenkiania ferrooxidans EGD-HP2]
MSGRKHSAWNSLLTNSPEPALTAAAGGGGGDLLILGCVACWAAYSVGSRGLSQALGPLQTVTWPILLGTAMLWLAAWLRSDASLAAIRKLGAAQWAGLFYLGALGSALAYIWYYDGIRRIGGALAIAGIALGNRAAGPGWRGLRPSRPA